MSTLPAEIVRFGSIWKSIGRITSQLKGSEAIANSMSETECVARGTDDDGEEGILPTLIGRLRRHVDTRQPASVSRMSCR